jgi:hypothetical protein
LPQADVSVGEETACRLRNVNAACGNPMKMVYPCLAHDPQSVVGLAIRSCAPANLEGHRTQNRYLLLLIALRAERQAEGMTYEY